MAQEAAEEADSAGDTLQRQEGQTLFAALDRKRMGILTRREARTWLRGLGWCLNEVRLDALLDGEGDPESKTQGAKTPSSSRGFWTLEDLLAIAERHRHVCGPDPEVIQASLRTLAGRGRRIATKDHLRQTVAETLAAVARDGAGGDGAPLLTEADLEEMMDICGVPATARALDMEALTNLIVEMICQPKVPCHRATRMGGRINFGSGPV